MSDNLNNKKKINLKDIILPVILGLIATVASVILIAAIMFLFEKGFEYSALFGTVSIAVGVLVTSFVMSYKRGKGGLFTGFLCGLITFLTVLLISLIIDKSEFSLNTLFHFLIYILSGIIGGVVGVNKKNNKKYI